MFTCVRGTELFPGDVVDLLGVGVDLEDLVEGARVPVKVERPVLAGSRCLEEKETTSHNIGRSRHSDVTHLAVVSAVLDGRCPVGGGRRVVLEGSHAAGVVHGGLVGVPVRVGRQSATDVSAERSPVLRAVPAEDVGNAPCGPEELVRNWEETQTSHLSS